MQVLYPRCAGLDVHQKTVVVTVMITQEDGTVQRERRTFSTMTADLLVLDDWLRQHQVDVIALESTGVYWCPVYNLLEEGRTVILVNARHMKAVPGRKTDMKDSEWIADLLRHGLLQASFIPPEPIRELREVTRYRKTLVQERAYARQSLAKSAGNGEPQAGSGCNECVREKWTRYADCHSWRTAGPGSLSRVGPRTITQQIAAIAASA